MNDIEQFITDRIQQSVLHKDPFVYTYIENIFPESQYNLLKSLVPSTAEFLDTGSSTKTHSRKVLGRSLLPLFEETIYTSNVSEQTLNFFMWVKDFLMPSIGRRLGVQYDPKESRLHWAFTSDTVGYYKRPHTDHPNKIFSILLYMSQSSTGTTILKPKQEGFIDPEGNDQRYDDFIPVYTAPFKPNNCLAFIRTNNSFHSVRRVTSEEPRLAFHAHVWYK